MKNPESKEIRHLELKQKAEISIEKAKETILQNIPKEEILSIYVKGSYVQGELQESSDVDIVVILKTNEYLPAVYELTEKFGKTTEPPFQAVAYTLEELKTGKWSPKRTKNSTTISSFVKHLDQLPLIYGSKPEGELFTRTDEKDLTALISAFRTNFLPGINDGSFKFDELVKQVLWLTERERRALGKIPDYSWQKLADSTEDENHIIHDALKFRRQRNVSKQEQEDFIKNLESHLVFLEAKFK